MSEEKVDWRKVGEDAKVDAQILRMALVDAEIYPPEEIDGTSWEEWSQRCKATMPEILEELDTTDLVALFRVAELLAAVERDPEVFRYSAFNSAITLARAGVDPSDNYDLEELGIQDHVSVCLENAARRAQDGQIHATS